MNLKKQFKIKIIKKMKQIWAMSWQIFSFMVEFAVTIAVLIGISIAVMKAPEIHGKYIRASVGSKVYMIRDSVRTGGGTGFAIKAPSGASYILTNDHVCSVSKDGYTVLVTSDAGSLRRRIIAHDENSDLCLVEGIPGIEGLSVAGFAPSLGDVVSAVGHPHLMPKHISNGEITGAEDITIPLGPISVINPNTGEEELINPKKGGIPSEQCRMKKHSQTIIDFNMIFMTLKYKYCEMTVKGAYTSGVVIYPGNSGSPTVNFWGNVVGVIFATNSTNWAYIVPFQDVTSFLRNY